MVELFKRCLNAQYTHCGESGDYAIEVENDTLYLLFECSSGKDDWKHNFDFPIAPYKDMKPKWYCHRGFLKVWKSIRDEIEAKVAESLEISPTIAKIICIGYSHGAALAVLATENFAFLYGDKIEVRGYGFGTPRVLWGVVPREVGERLKNFVSIRNIPDLVTRVPPKWLFYKDAGTLLEIGEKGKYNCIKAHYASAYIDELEAYIQQDAELLLDLEDRA